MVKKLMVCVLLGFIGSLSAMDCNNNYITKITGLGLDVQREVIYDPMIAEMMRSMNRAEDNDYVTEAAKKGRIITHEQARAEINRIKQQLEDAGKKEAQNYQEEQEREQV